MRYPKMTNWLRVKKVTESYTTLVNHLTGDECQIRNDAYRFLTKLDGKTDPYKVPSSLTAEERKTCIELFEENLFTRKGRLITSGGLLFTLWVPKKTKDSTKLSRVINATVFLSWLPLIILGVLSVINHIDSLDYLEDNHIVMWTIVSFVISIVAHEFGHYFAAKALGAYVFEMGIGISGGIPCAYNLVYSNECSRARRIQISAAGVEVNCVIAGLAMIIGSFFPETATACLFFVVNNALLVAINMLLLPGVDGMTVFAELLGLDVEDLVDASKKIVKRRTVRNRLAKKGVMGLSKITLAYSVRLMNFAYVIVIVLNIVEMILWIIQ
ncbi:MAG: M50 family metallopeptidase [Clostridia bacterium]|nr:M50 family metallopeptidase [Clostridia bacterium]